MGSRTDTRTTAIALGVLALVGAAVLLWSLERPPRTGPVQHVLIVSLDGVSSAALATLGPAGAPHLHALAADGAYTMNARTDPDSTETLPNHISMLTGRAVAEHHSTDNVTAARAPIAPGMDGLFDVVAAAGEEAALIATKSKLQVLADRWRGALAVADVGERTDADAIDALSRLLQARTPALIFLHLSGADRAGHAQGWGSDAYLAAVTEVDARLGEAVARMRQVEGPLAIIVTSDHGGRGQVHTDVEDAANYTIPLVVVAPDVHGDLYPLNSGRRSDPRQAKVAAPMGSPPIRSSEVANMAARLLGLGTVPGSTAGADLIP